ncbi:MAG: DnaJ C-terminal domain-containing protein, partial [Phycisphaerae bacterium]
VEVPISIAQAALGADVEIPTLFGKSSLHVAPGTQPGQVLKVKGLGLPDLRGGRTGDLIAAITVEVPRKLNKKQEQLLREFAATEERDVLPAQTSFFDKLKDYLVGTQEPDEARAEKK